jgi:hypothetical protein
MATVHVYLVNGKYVVMEDAVNYSYNKWSFNEQQNWKVVTWFAQDTRNIPRILIVNTNAGQIKVAECNCYIEVAYCLEYLLM